MYTTKTCASDMQRIRACVRPFLENPGNLPVSFTVGRKTYNGIPDSFAPTVQKRFLDASMIEYIFRGTDPETNITITVEGYEYLDFPVIEWTAWLENTGTEDTPVIQNFCGMDKTLPGTDPVVIYNNGDTNNEHLYTDIYAPLNITQQLVHYPNGGRGCDCALPYYRVLCDDFGYTISIGWPGQWLAQYDLEENGFHLKATQQYLNCYLKPGEKIRSARMSIMTFEHGLERGINLWRRWMFAHVLPKPQGALPKPMVSAVDHGVGVFGTQATEEQQLAALESFKASNLNYDNLWFDAGWYPCKRENGDIDWNCTGTLGHDKERFPNGMQPIGQKCHEYGKTFTLWFEPERVYLKGMLGEYPDSYVLRLKDESALDKIRYVAIARKLCEGMGLMNLGDPECCDWVINRVDSLIKEYGVDIYRQDFNFPPLHWWLQNDEEDRLGITENLYNQGYLRFWDELLLRNPGLLINSCAAGGRRCDMETQRRSVPLHQSDYGAGEHPIEQAVRTFSAIWEPYFGTLTDTSEDEHGEYNYKTPLAIPDEDKRFDNFLAHNTFGPSYFTWFIGKHCTALPDGEYAKTEENQYYEKYAAIWKRAVPYTLDSDFYVLTMTDRTNTCWYAIQFHNEEQNAGIIQAIRNNKAPDDTYTAWLRQIDPGKAYIFESPEFEKNVTVSGQNLLSNGFPITLPARTGEIWFYRAI